MAEPREIRVKLTVDTSEFIAAIKEASEAAKLLSACGVGPEDMGDAVKSTLKLTREAPATHGPGYTLSYIEFTIQNLSTRGLTITPVDVLTGIWKLNKAGIEGSDAETALYAFLLRLSPHHDMTNSATFQGWPGIAASLAGKSNEELFARFGSGVMRVAAVARG